MKTKLITTVIVCSMAFAVAQAKTKIIAHRGYWKVQGSAHNTISALKNAQGIGVYGSELDVHLCNDGVLAVYHDNAIANHEISDHPYQTIQNFKLSNGEEIPTLESYIQQAKQARATKLIIEIKPKNDSLLEASTVQAVVDMVKKHKMTSQVEYISFSLQACKQLVAMKVKSPVAFLASNATALAPAELKKLGISGLDYHYSVLLKNPQWIIQAKQLKISTNCWTVNDVDIIKKLAAQGVDFITTDIPVEAQKAIREI